jgi:hypothetical protein
MSSTIRLEDTNYEHLGESLCTIPQKPSACFASKLSRYTWRIGRDSARTGSSSYCIGPSDDDCLVVLLKHQSTSRKSLYHEMMLGIPAVMSARLPVSGYSNEQNRLAVTTCFRFG